MENQNIVPIANELYKNDYHLFKNYLTPCFKLKEKVKVGSRFLLPLSCALSFITLRTYSAPVFAGT
jgi:hypothetical protein